MEAAGIEPAVDPCISKDLQQSIDQKARKSAVSRAEKAPERVSDAPDFAPDLQAVIEAWPSLPEPVKAGILAMVKVARNLNYFGILAGVTVPRIYLYSKPLADSCCKLSIFSLKRRGMALSDRDRVVVIDYLLRNVIK